jgi:hypothetical protein
MSAVAANSAGDEDSRKPCTPSCLMHPPNTAPAISRSHGLAQSNAHNHAHRRSPQSRQYLS